MSDEFEHDGQEEQGEQESLSIGDAVREAAAEIAARNESSSEPPGAPDSSESTTVEMAAVPKAWPQEMHGFWGKLDPKVQTYLTTREKQMLDGLDQYKNDAAFAKQLRQVYQPFAQILKTQGIDELSATQYLLNAHHKLSTSPAEERLEYFQRLAKSYGLDLPPATDGKKPDEIINNLTNRINSIESSITEQMDREFQANSEKIAHEVNAFADDPNHPYFDEIAGDVASFVRAGNDLASAYEKAVWANPVTRQKEIARLQTEEKAKLADKAKQEAASAKKAASINVRGRDTGKAPTEPTGTMRDTIKETMNEIRSRVH